MVQRAGLDQGGGLQGRGTLSLCFMSPPAGVPHLPAVWDVEGGLAAPAFVWPRFATSNSS